MEPHPLTNFEIQNYYQNNAQLSSMNEPKFNGVSWRNNLYKIKDGAYVINLHEDESIGAHWIALYVNDINVTYFDSFEVKHTPKEIEKFIGNKNVITNICKIQAHNSIMCG